MARLKRAVTSNNPQATNSEGTAVQIVELRTTPLHCRLKEPYYWSQGVQRASCIILIEVETSEGIVGIGEVMASPSIESSLAALDAFRPMILHESIYDGARIMRRCYQAGYATRGNGSAPRHFAQMFSGIEISLWDAIGKAAKQPLHRLLGGALRDQISYFGFIQGDGPEQLAAHARQLLDQGFPVLYLKVGRGAEQDLAAVQAVRSAIGKRRLRLDANEAWDSLTARRMMTALAAFDIETMEQPLPASTSRAALARLRTVTTIPVVADQSAFELHEIYDLCRDDAVDMITLGLHETAGISGLRRAAAIAQAAGINICNHGVFESGITTCAAMQVLATIPNLDDGNQIMSQLLEEDLVLKPALTLESGTLPLSMLPGLGFELDWEAVNRAAKVHLQKPLQ